MHEAISQAPEGQRRTAGGDHTAVPETYSAWQEFGSVYEACLPFVLRYTLARVSNPQVAEDLVGETFERALLAWPTFGHHATARTWVLGIARHVIADYWRRGAPASAAWGAMPEEAPAPQSTLEEVAQKSEGEHRLRQALACLGEHDQELLALRYAADLPLREVARVLGLRETATRVRLHRVLKRLRVVLDDKEE